MKRKLLSLIIAIGIASSCSQGNTDGEFKLWTTFRPVFSVENGATTPIPADGELPDGVYWGLVQENLGPEIVFELSRARFGATCEEWAAEKGMAEGCANDYAIDDSQRRFITASNLQNISIAKPTEPDINYRLDAVTFKKLIQSEKVDAPSGYQWTPFPFIISIKDGQVVAADQFWVP